MSDRFFRALIIVTLLLAISFFLKKDLGKEGLSADSIRFYPDNSNLTEATVGTIDEKSGLVVDEGFEFVKLTCGACHSTKLVAQNRLSREGWAKLIRWMQHNHNLWDLGEREQLVLDYLENNYAPVKSGRRNRLENINWYVLNE